MTSFMSQEEMTKAIMKLKVKTKENETALKDIYPKLVMIQSEIIQAEKRNQTLLDKINEMNSFENINKNKTNEESLQQQIYKCTTEVNSFKDHLTQQRGILMELEMKYFTDFKTLKEKFMDHDNILKDQEKEHECKIDELQRQMSDNFINIQLEQKKNFDQINDLKSKIKEQNEILKQHKSDNGYKFDDIQKHMSHEVLELKEKLKQLNEINNMKSQISNLEKTFNVSYVSKIEFEDSQKQISNKLIEIQEQLINFTSQVTDQTKNFNQQLKQIDNEILYIKMQIFNIVNGINIRKQTTPLHHACEYGLIEIALEQKYDGSLVNAVNKEGMTPLHLACKFGLNDVAIQLLNHGADANASNNDGMTPLHFICNNDLLEVYKPPTLGYINIKYENDRNFLHFAIKTNQDVYIIEELMRIGADLNCKDAKDWSPLHFAAHSGYDILVEKLINAGADVHCKNSKGQTPLHLAATRGINSFEILDEIDDAILSDDNTPINFYLGSGREHLAVITNLILHGANINCKDNDNNTPLMFAISIGFFPAVIKLLDNGANINVYHQKTCLNTFQLAVMFGHQNIAAELLNRGALINGQDEKGFTALHIAAGFGDVSMLTFLLNHGALINRKNDKGNTALHIAAKWGTVSVLTFLLNHGADIGCTNKHSQTALDVAAENNKTEAIKILKHQTTL